MTPTARTLAACRKLGWEPDVVERWIGGGCIKVRRDLFGCIDLVVLDGRPGLLGIQATSGSNGSSRVKKMSAEPRARAWLLAGNRIAKGGPLVEHAAMAEEALKPDSWPAKS